MTGVHGPSLPGMGVGHVLPLVPKDPNEEVKTRPGVKGRSQSLASCILHQYPFCGQHHTEAERG